MSTQRKRMTKRERTIQIYTRVLLCIIVFVVAICITVSFANRQKPYGHDINKDKYAVVYTSHFIGTNETVYSISKDILERSSATREYISIEDEMKEIARINKIDPNDIKYGENLLVPYIMEIKREAE